MSQFIPESIGILAGRGHYPKLMCQQARAAGVKNIAVVGLVGDTSPDIADYCDSLEWVYVGQLSKTIKSFRRRGVSECVMVGQVKPGRLFKGMRPDLKALRILTKLKERNAESMFGAVCDVFEKGGVKVLSAVTFLEDFLAGEGVLNDLKPSAKQLADASYGFRTAKQCSRLDIGQSVVVKRGTVLAVEGFEGTDKCIRRGGELGRGGVVVCKVAKDGHDMRFDVPCIGMRTVESLLLAKARVLCVETGMTLFIERDRVLQACKEAGITVIGMKEACQRRFEIA